MQVTGTIVTTKEKQAAVEAEIEKRLKELDLDFETETTSMELREIKVTLKLNGLKAIKHLFNIVKAPEEEIKYLTKVNSVVIATAKDILNSVLQSIKG